MLSGVDETSCPFRFVLGWEWERECPWRCFVVVRCCDECFPFLLPLFHAGYPCVGASREHWIPTSTKWTLAWSTSPGMLLRQPVRVKSSQDSCKLRGPCEWLAKCLPLRPSLAVFRKSLVLDNCEMIPHWFTWWLLNGTSVVSSWIIGRALSKSPPVCLRFC